MILVPADFTLTDHAYEKNHVRMNRNSFYFFYIHMTLTTKNLFGETVEYPNMQNYDTPPHQDQETINDTLTGNLFMQDFVDNTSDEIWIVLQSKN